jgi:hypothetical protein
VSLAQGEPGRAAPVLLAVCAGIGFRSDLAMDDEIAADRQKNKQIWLANQTWLIRWSAILMFGVVLSLVGFVFWAASNFGPHVEPCLMWVTTDPRYEHLVEALDSHAPDWTKTDALAAALLRPSEEKAVNWVMGLVPISDTHFLVTQHFDDQRWGVSLALYPATSANVGYWTRWKVGGDRAVEGEERPQPTSVVTIPSDTPRGRHRMEFPAPFHARSEVIVMFTTTNRAIEPWRWGFGPTCVLIARPRAGEIEVVPMTWHAEDHRIGPNNNIERLFRDPATGRLFGDGDWLRPFVLKEDPRELESWLR